MRTVVVSPPEPLVDWIELDRHLRLAGDTTEQAYVESLAAAASALLDGPGSCLGRAVAPQTLEVYLDCFPRRSIELPYPEVISVESVKYVDADGAEQTIDPADYSVAGRFVSLKSGQWPTIGDYREAVKVRYQAGYFEEIPAPIKMAAMLLVGHWFNSREAVAIGVSATEMPLSVDALIGPYRRILV